MKKSMLIVCCLVLCITGKAIAQNKHIVDSLEQVLKTLRQDTNRVNVMDKIGWQYRSTDPLKARTYLNESLKLANKLNFYSGQAEANNMIALSYDYEGNYPEALKYFNRTLDIATKNHHDTRIARVLDNMGGMYRRMANYDSSLALFNRALKIKQQAKDNKGMALTYEQIGVVYITKGDYSRALDYTLKAMRIREAEDQSKLGSTYVSVAIIYMQLSNYKDALFYYDKALKITQQAGDTENLLGIYINRCGIYMNTGEYPKALADNDSALAILKNSDNAAALISCYTNAGSIYKTMGNNANALQYYKLALDLANKIEDLSSQATVNNSLGEIAGKQKQYVAALQYLKQGNLLAVRINSLEYLKENYLAYANVYSGMGHHKKAYDYRLLYEAVWDSLFNENNNKQITEMKTKYETEKKEREIVLLNNQQKIQDLNIARQQLTIQKRNYQLLAVAGLVVLSIIIAFLINNRNKIRQQARLDKAVAEQEQIRIRTVLETEQSERVRIAKDLHDELGSGISKIMLSNELAKKHINGNESLNSVLHTIDKTISTLAGNMNDLIWSLQVEHATIDILFAKMREFASDFFDESSIEPKFDMHADNADQPISKEILRDVFLVYKEALNNAMKYSGASIISIKAIAKQDRLEIAIKDNGKGLADVKHAGNGIPNMQNRINKHHGSFTISGTDGTAVEMTLNLKA